MIMAFLQILAEPESYAVQVKGGEIYIRAIESVNPATLYPKER